MIKIYLDLVSKLPVWLLLSVSGTVVILGDFCGKLWSQDQKPILFWISVISYFLSGILFLPTLLREGLTLTSVIWSLISIIGFVFIGLVIFKESLTLWQSVGVVFGVISLVIFALFK